MATARNMLELLSVLFLNPHFKQTEPYVLH